MHASAPTSLERLRSVGRLPLGLQSATGNGAVIITRGVHVSDETIATPESVPRRPSTTAYPCPWKTVRGFLIADHDLPVCLNTSAEFCPQQSCRGRPYVDFLHRNASGLRVTSCARNQPRPVRRCSCRARRKASQGAALALERPEQLAFAARSQIAACRCHANRLPFQRCRPSLHLEAVSASEVDPVVGVQSDRRLHPEHDNGHFAPPALTIGDAVSLQLDQQGRVAGPRHVSIGASSIHRTKQSLHRASRFLRFKHPTAPIAVSAYPKELVVQSLTQRSMLPSGSITEDGAACTTA